MFRCDQCESVMDRDVNGVKNIFLKNFEALGLSIEGERTSAGAYFLSRADSWLQGKSAVARQ